MVEHPAEYRWSSYRVNAQCEWSELVTPHAQYSSLGRGNTTVAEAYRELFRSQLEVGLVDQIRMATNGNYVLGNSRFAADVESMVGRRVQRGSPGRPRKILTPQ